MYSVTKAFLAGLAVLGGVRAQPTMFNIPASSYLDSTWGPMGQVTCNISQAFPSDNSIPVTISAFDAIPQTMLVGSAGIQIPYVDGTIIYNGAFNNSLIIDCNAPVSSDCGTSFNFATAAGTSACGSIGNGTSIDCVLYKAPNEANAENASVRLHAKGYMPSAMGFPADAVINIEPGKPFGFSYQSDESSNIEFLAASSEDKLYSSQAAVFLNCKTQQSNAAATKLSLAA